MRNKAKRRSLRRNMKRLPKARRRNLMRSFRKQMNHSILKRALRK